jgi:hypothetical protein
MGDLLDDLRSCAAATRQRDERVPGGVEGLVLDTRVSASPRPELRPTLLGVVHEPFEASALSPSDDEVRRTRFAAVHELEALFPPPAELACEYGVDRDLPRPLTLPSFRLEGPTVVLRDQMDAAERCGRVVDIAPPEAADLAFAHAREECQRGEDAGLGFRSNQPNDLLESIGLPCSATVLSTQEAARQDARVDEHELLPSSIAARGPEQAVDVRHVLLAKQTPRLFAHGFKQLTH